MWFRLMLPKDLQPERTKPIADEQAATMTLRGHFLIATPAIHRGFFNRSLTYLCRHDESGAMGIVVNQRLDITFIEMAQHLAIPTDLRCQISLSWQEGRSEKTTDSCCTARRGSGKGVKRFAMTSA